MLAEQSLKTGNQSGRLCSLLILMRKGGDSMENLAIIILAIILLVTILSAFIILYKLARKNRPHTRK